MFSHCVPLVSSWQVSQTSPILDDCGSSETLAQKLVKCLSGDTCWMFLSWLDGIMGPWEEGWMTKCHSHRVTSRVSTLSRTMVLAALQEEEVFVRSLQCQVHFPFSVLDFLEKSYYTQLTLKKRRVVSPLGQNISINCFKFFCMEDLSPSCLFISFKICRHQSATKVIWILRNA